MSLLYRTEKTKAEELVLDCLEMYLSAAVGLDHPQVLRRIPTELVPEVGAGKVGQRWS